MRTRLGALAFAAAGVLFFLYPAVRPWHDESTVNGAATSMSSGAWVAAHLFAMIGFILVPLGLLALRDAIGGTLSSDVRARLRPLPPPVLHPRRATDRARGTHGGRLPMAGGRVQPLRPQRKHLTGKPDTRLRAGDTSAAIDHHRYPACDRSRRPRLLQRSSRHDRTDNRSHSVSRTKSDHGDVVVLARSLHTDPAAHQPLPAESEQTQVITMLIRASRTRHGTQRTHRVRRGPTRGRSRAVKSRACRRDVQRSDAEPRGG